MEASFVKKLKAAGRAVGFSEETSFLRQNVLKSSRVLAGYCAVLIGLAHHFSVPVRQGADPSRSQNARKASAHRAKLCESAMKDQSRSLGSGVVSESGWIQGMRTRLFDAEMITDPVEQRDALLACMNELTAGMAADLLATMSPAELKGLAAHHLFDVWVMAKPIEAAAWAGNLMDGESMPPLLNLVALRWAVSDLKEAVSWLHTLPAGSLKDDLTSVIGCEAVRSDPLEALRLAAELPASAAQENLVRRAASEWAATAPSSAKEWAEKIEDGMLRERVIRDIAVVHAERDPAAAVSILLARTASSEDQDRAIVSIVQSWTRNDPTLVATWVEQFPDDRLGMDAIDNMIHVWVSKDEKASGEWLRTLPRSTMRTAGMLAYARELGRTNQTLAERWASYASSHE